MPQQQARATLLGPNPGNGSYSTTEYFRFLADNLQPALGEAVASHRPGLSQAGETCRQTPARVGPRRQMWVENYILWPRTLSTLRYDLFHIVDQGLGWYARHLKGGQRLATIHDLFGYLSMVGKIALPRPPRHRRLLIRENVCQLKRMHHLVCVSQYTADCAVRELEVPASRITVLPNHLGEVFRLAGSEQRIAARVKWFGAAEHVVLHVGSSTRYKNRPGVIKAFHWVKSSIPSAELFLVHGPGTLEETAFVRELGLESCVRFLPPLTTAQLTEAYGAADVFVFPSMFEGFGWPPIEAMACGCPVVCTRGGALAEVVGDAALTVADPSDHKAIGDAVREVLTSGTAARQLRERGLKHVEKYRPKRRLPEMANLYRMLLAN